MQRFQPFFFLGGGKTSQDHGLLPPHKYKFSTLGTPTRTTPLKFGYPSLAFSPNATTEGLWSDKVFHC